MLVMGMMSGTSADGIDVTLARISGAPPELRARFEGHFHSSFPPYLRETILRLANVKATTTAEISELNFLLGEQLAKAAIKAARHWRVALGKISLIGSHGQTIFHMGANGRFQGKIRAASTLQIGDISIVAERTGITTVGDFRPADMAAGGQGAPLLPFADYLLYRDALGGRVALNIGGIANVAVIPPKARPKDVFAFDTGPGNMIVDALVERTTRGRASYDRDARIALGGRPIQSLRDRASFSAQVAPRNARSPDPRQFRGASGVTRA